MPKAPLVHANGAAIPAIGLGTWRLSGEACSQAVIWGVEAGYRHVDTAAMYDNEEAVVEGLRSSGVPRDEVFVTTKVWPSELRPGDLQRSAEASLRRLGLSQVDLFLIHWPNLEIPLADSIGALNDVKRRGLARHIGVSNFSATLLDEAVGLSAEPLVVNQCEYHPLLDQSRVRAACQRHGLAFTSYCPLGRGELPKNPVVQEIAARHGRTAGQILLRWHVQQPATIAIPKSGNRDRIVQNLDVFDFSLSDDEMARISGLARPDGRMVNVGFPGFDEAA